MRENDVTKVTCKQEQPLQNHQIRWKAIGESKTVETNNTRNSQVLTIRGTSINAPQSKFTCSRENFVSKEKEICCTVIVEIQLNEISPTPGTTMKTLSATLQTESRRPTSANLPSATATSATNFKATSKQNGSIATTDISTLAFTTSFFLNGTPFQNVSSGAFNSFETVTISATVSAAAVFLLGVGAAVIIGLKRKQLSDRVASNDCSDNLAYTLDVKQQQVWNGNKIIPLDCLQIGKSLGKRTYRRILEKWQTAAILGEGQFGTVAEGKLRTRCNKGIIYDRRIAIKMLKSKRMRLKII